jgi:hypothetical protein
LATVGCCYAAVAFSFWSVLGLFLGNDNNGVVFSLGSVPRWYFVWGQFRGGIFFGVRSEGVFLCYDKRAYSKAERETLNPGQTKLLNNDKRAYKLLVSKFCESEMATKDTHLVL